MTTATTGLKGTLPRLRKPHRKTILLAALASAALGTAAGIYQHYLAATRIAFVNFRGVQLARLERAKGNQAIRIEPLALDALDRAASYPVVVVHGRGLELNETHIEQLREAGRRGVHLYVRGATNPEHDITNLQGRQLEHVSGYFRFGGTENYARLLNFSRVELDGKSFRSDPVQPPAERAMDVLFHLDDRLTFETVAAFRTYYEAQGLEASIAGIDRHRHGLRDSSDLELSSVVRALDGGYVEPSPGGDPIVNPDAVPTGRNLYSIDAERTPSREAWAVGRRLGDSLVDEHRRRHGAYPKKVAFTLWPTDFIGTEGATIGQIFYLLGVEPVWDPRGRVGDLRLIPSADLGRPRIDVVVQTAGQLRDLAASRLALINRAVAMAAEARDAGGHANFVHAGRLRAEEVMKERGLSPADARRYSTLRVFGGVNGNYGTAIMEMVERSDRWEDDAEVAGQYLRNMGAVYDQGELWSFYADGLFAAALADTEIVVQPRQSHTWGALSLDHVFEFMGGLSLAVRHVTGKDADAYFNDFRNMHRPRVTDLHETVWTEARSTLLNPAYIGKMQEGGASSAEHFAETFRNTYGWNVMKPAAIDDTLWNELYAVYVDDRYDLGVEAFFRRENPYALQEMTAVMLETVRKGYWDASPRQVAVLSEMHTRLVQEFEAGCSGFVCDNAALASFIAEQAPADLAAAYRSELQRNLTPSVELTEAGIVLSEQQEVEPRQANSPATRPSAERRAWLGALLVAGLFLVALFVLRRLRSTL